MTGTFPSQVGAMAVVWGGLLLWRLSADRLSCPLSAVVLVLVAGSLMLSSTEVAFFRRHAFLSHYLVPQGFLFRLLGRRFLIVFWHSTKGLLLGLVLLVSSLNLTSTEWLVLLADVLVMAYLVEVLSRILNKEVRAPYRAPMARHWAVRSNAVLLWLALICTRFVSPQANYEGLLWEEVAVLGASQVALGCDALAVLARINGVAEALAFWAAQNLFGTLQRPAQVLMSWLVFLASFGVSFLLAWLYSRALAGTLSRPFRVWQNAEEVN